MAGKELVQGDDDRPGDKSADVGPQGDAGGLGYPQGKEELVELEQEVKTENEHGGSRMAVIKKKMTRTLMRL